jgi:hypothetical protein
MMNKKMKRENDEASVCIIFNRIYVIYTYIFIFKIKIYIK